MALSMSNIHLSYGKKKVLNNLNIASINRGVLTALIGANGTGKSSLFRLIAGITKNRRGTITLEGQDLERMPSKQRSLAVCYVPQLTDYHIRLTVFEGLMLALNLASAPMNQHSKEQKVSDIMQLLNISELANQFLADLSGGQKQLVAIGQGLIRNPSVLLLDEPTSALDLSRQLQVMMLLADYVKQHNMLCIIAIHDLNLASRFCPQMIALHQGACLAQGPTPTTLNSQLAEQMFNIRLNKVASNSGYDLLDAQYIA